MALSLLHKISMLSIYVYVIEGQAVVDEQYPHICIPFVQVGEGSVQCNGDCVVRGSVRAVGELERVECVGEGGGDMVFD